MSTGTAVVTLDAPELEAVEASKAEQIRQTFVPMADMLAEFEADYVEITSEAKEGVTPELSQKARRLRLDIAKVRIEAEKLRKALKQEYLLAGRAIDGTNNVLKWAISRKEEALESIEKHAERMEAERLTRLQEERVKALTPYVEDAGERDLGSMEEDVWDAYLAAKKQEHADRVEAERKAEAERIERERVEKLDRKRTREVAPFYDFFSADHRDDLGAMPEDEYTDALAVAKKAKADHEAEQERLRQERERLEAEAARKEAAREKEREEERKRLEAERKKREALEAAEAERKAAEKAERKAREKAEREAAKAPVKKRLAGWVDTFALPDLPGDDHEAAETIRSRFAEFRAWAAEQVEAI